MQMANTPMLHSKFLHLKKLSIALTARTFTPAYDYFSLVSFLDACPSLESGDTGLGCKLLFIFL
jgi:hypothetical protein